LNELKKKTASSESRVLNFSLYSSPMTRR